MYVSTFSPLQIALSGVEAAQEELQTTGENITNENTAGYVDETVNLTESASLTFADGSAPGEHVQLGTGVDVQSVTNNANQYLDATYRTQTAAASSASTDESYLGQLQSALGEPSTSAISGQLATFWGAWNSLAESPTSSAAKQVVLDDGDELADSLNQLSAQFSSISSQATTQYNSITGTGGSLVSDADQIAQLNGAIKSATLGGQNANTLIDQRNAMLNNLSSLATIYVTNQPDGTVSVNFGAGVAAMTLVSGTTVNWPQTFTGNPGGTLGALISLTAPGGQISQYSSQLDSVASALVSEVNGVSGLSTPFFTGATASTIAVGATLSQISATSNPLTNPGGNDVATAEADLSGGLADQSYGQFVSAIGAGVQTAQNTSTTQSALQTAVFNQQQSFEGVDLSQETANMEMEQQAYQASAQVMNAFNTMMNSLMSAVGGG
jgi:flagellar hook-associated protein 1 FlgK